MFRGKTIFIVCKSETTAVVSDLLFHGKGSNREMMCRPSPLEKLALRESRRSERCD